MKSKISKKDLREALKISIFSAIEKMNIASSKKVKKIASNVATRLSAELKYELKKLVRQNNKNGKLPGSPSVKQNVMANG